jgi:hypothetical protein
MAFDGTDLWISDAATDAVTEHSANGTLIRKVTNASLDRNSGFNAPTAVVASGTDIYVISPPGASPMVTTDRINRRRALVRVQHQHSQPKF